MILRLPFYCRTECTEYYLFIDKQGALISCRRKGPGTWEEEEALLEGCQGFCAAPGTKGLLHVIAQDANGCLKYFLLAEKETRKGTFLIEHAHGPFLLAFSSMGNGYFACTGEKNILTTATFTPKGWIKGALSCGSAPVPYYLAVDKAGGVHLVVFDAAEQALVHILCDSSFGSVRSTFILETSLDAPCSTALWLDEGLNIHIAWHDGKNICYRKKSPGGWPSGGWQPKKEHPLPEVPCLVSFYNGDNNLLLLAGLGEGRALVYDLAGDVQQTVQLPPDKNQPVRFAAAGQTCVDFTNQGLPREWFFTAGVAAGPGQEGPKVYRDEDDNELLLHARRLMAEKKQLENELRQKEASLSQLRQMLEMVQENKNRQTVVLNERLTELDRKVRELREELDSKNKLLQAKEEEKKEAGNRLLETVNQLERCRDLYEECRANAASLQEQLNAVVSRESELLAIIKKLEEEAAQRKNIWGPISSLFHKTPSSKK